MTTAACTGPMDEPMTSTRDRSYDYFWPLTRVTERGRAGWAGVELSVYHDRDRKRLGTSLYPTTHLDDGGRQTRISLLASAPWVRRRAVDRYSAKALAAFTEEALAEFRAAFTGGHEGIRALFTPDNANEDAGTASLNRKEKP